MFSKPFPKPACDPHAKGHAGRRDKRKQKNKNVCFVLDIETSEKARCYPVADRLRRHRKNAIRVSVPDSAIQEGKQDKTCRISKYFESSFHRDAVTFS